MSVRESPSRALLVDACDVVACSGCAVLEATTCFSQPLRDVQGRVYAPPFTIDHIRDLWALARMPSGAQDIWHLKPTNCPLVGIPRSLLQLQGIVSRFWKWQVFL